MKRRLYIYQSRNGAIQIGTGGNKVVALEEKQVNDLGINVYELEDFDIDDYRKFYNNRRTHLTPAEPDPPIGSGKSGENL